MKNPPPVHHHHDPREWWRVARRLRAPTQTTTHSLLLYTWADDPKSMINNHYGVLISRQNADHILQDRDSRSNPSAGHREDASSQSVSQSVQALLSDRCTYSSVRARPWEQCMRSRYVLSTYIVVGLQQALAPHNIIVPPTVGLYFVFGHKAAVYIQQSQKQMQTRTKTKNSVCHSVIPCRLHCIIRCHSCHHTPPLSQHTL